MPLRFLNKLSANTDQAERKENDLIFAFDKQDTQIIKFLLKLLKHRKLGRRKMNELLIENDIHISEYKLLSQLYFALL